MVPTSPGVWIALDGVAHWCFYDTHMQGVRKACSFRWN
jgi:hypothetical protein